MIRAAQIVGASAVVVAILALNDWASHAVRFRHDTIALRVVRR